MQHLEIRELRLIASFCEDLEAALDQRRSAATEHSLLAKEVRLGLLSEGCFKYTCTCAADALRVAQGKSERISAGVLLNSDEARDAATFSEDFPDAVPRRLRRNERDVGSCGRGDRAEADVEAMRKHQRDTGLHVVSDFVVIDLGSRLIGNQIHDDISPLGNIGNGVHYEAGKLCFLRVGRTRT